VIAWFQRNPLIAALCALAAALAVLIGLETGFGTGLRNALPPARRAVPAEAKLLPPVIATAPEQAYPETAARPIFTPTRRPAPEGAAVAKGSLTPGQFVLQGVTIAGNNRIALLREKASGRIVRVVRGGEVSGTNGIKVAEVQATSVTLTQGGDKEVLSLDVQKPTGAPSAAMPVGPFSGAAPAQPQPPASPAGMAPAPAQPGVPVAPSQFQAAPTPRIGAAAAGQPVTPGANAPVPAAPQSTAAPMTPEELLARRRARRTQTQ
jgi:general secretion pathway protein N